VRDIFRLSSKRAYEYIDTIMARQQEQWNFYKEVRILNPVNLIQLDHDVSKYSCLRFPSEDGIS
jgi:hypothetical protein